MQTNSSNNQTATEELPTWLKNIVRKQDNLNNLFIVAEREAIEAYNELLAILEEINDKHGTEFTIAEMVAKYRGDYVDIEPDDDEYDDETE